MKTPRDILLGRHQAVAPKLDAIRRSVVAELNHQGTKGQSFPAGLIASLLGCSSKLWSELVWPCRRIWAGLAAVWIGILIVNLSQRDPAPVNGTQTLSPMVMMSFRDQQKMLNELFAERAVPDPAERPRDAFPKPRTEYAETVAV